MPMKKMLCLLLALVLSAWLFCPVSAADGDPFFVAVNDAIPMTVTNGKPTYTAGGLIVPYSVFDAAPGGVATAYDYAAQTLVLFTRSRRLIFYLDQDKAVDESGNTYDAVTSYKSGVLYVPATFCAQHFGLKCTLLTDRNGYQILRFTDGNEAYDDAAFSEKAEGLILSRIQSFVPIPENETASDAEKEEEEAELIPVYPAFVNVEQMEQAAALLQERGECAAFFFTGSEITENPALVRILYAAGHQIGLTAAPGSEDPAAALSSANQALYTVLHRKTLLALVTEEQAAAVSGYCVFPRPTEPQSVTELVQLPSQRLLLCTEDPQSVLDNIDYAGAALCLLRETSFLNEP